jgi:NitT/TauT family transport system substrate-binding protein
MNTYRVSRKLGFIAAIAALVAVALVPRAGGAELAQVPAVAAALVPKGDGGKVRLLYSEFGTNSYVPFIMKKFALDRKYGFELQTIPAATTQARLTALQSGGAEMGTIDWHEISRLQKAGLNVVGVAPFLRWGADFVVVRSDSPAKNLGDLRGKKMGVYSRTSLNWLIERTVAHKIYKLDLEKEATVQEAAVPLLRGLLEQGQLDAAEIFNSVTPAMIATGKFKVLSKVSDLVGQLGLPDTPFLLYAVESGYAAKNPQNVKAFVAAYQETVQILRDNDDVWIERGREMKMTDEVAALFRTEARTDIWKKFEGDTEANIRKVFDLLFASAGVEILGMTELPARFMTRDFE